MIYVLTARAIIADSAIPAKAVNTSPLEETAYGAGRVSMISQNDIIMLIILKGGSRMSDERERLYSRAIKERDSLPIRGQWAKTVRKEIKRKRKRQEEKKQKQRKFW